MFLNAPQQIPPDYQKTRKLPPSVSHRLGLLRRGQQSATAINRCAVRARAAGATPVLVIGGDSDSYIRGLRRLRGEPGDAPTDYDNAEGNNGT